MHESFLRDVALVLGVAAVTCTFTNRLRLPSVLGYLIAGLIIGPYLPIPLFADPHRVQSLSEFGVILVMFSVGMEFRLSKFFRVLPTAGVTAAIEIGSLFLVGTLVGLIFDWSPVQSLFLGGALSISSTMLVSKIFEEDAPPAETKDHVLGILVIQDFVAILLLTIFGAFAASNQLSFDSILPTVIKLVFTLSFLTVIGLFFVPKYIRYISSLKSYEALIIVSTGICFVLALLVESLGYSVALGAFLAGILVAESGESAKIEEISKPLKDVFVAIFFVSVGMTVDPFLAFEKLPISIFIAFILITFQTVSVFAGSVVSGAGLKCSLRSSLSLGQIGEFSFIITAIGVGAGVLDNSFQAIIVSVSVITSLSTPLLWKNSELIAEKFSRWMPSKMRFTIGLYEAWFQRLRQNPISEDKFWGIPKRVMIGLFIDSLLLISLPPLFFKFLPGILNKVGIEENTFLSVVVLFLLLAIVLSPLLYGFAKISSSLIIHLSNRIFPVQLNPTKEKTSAEKLFKMTIWSILCVVVGLPLMISVSFFMDHSIFIAALVLTLIAVFSQLWRSAGTVAFEFETGGEKIMSVLKKQTFGEISHAPKRAPLVVPGLDKLDAYKVTNKEIVGKSLAQLNIRSSTGATLVSIERSDGTLMFPSDAEIVLADDVFHVWGTQDSKPKLMEIFGFQG